MTLVMIQMMVLVGGFSGGIVVVNFFEYGICAKTDLLLRTKDV